MLAPLKFKCCNLPDLWRQTPRLAILSDCNRIYGLQRKFVLYYKNYKSTKDEFAFDVSYYGTKDVKYIQDMVDLGYINTPPNNPFKPLTITFKGLWLIWNCEQALEKLNKPYWAQFESC